MATAKRFWAFGTLLAMGVIMAVAGCEPPPIMTAPPPGVDLRSTIEVKEEASEALGETAGQAAAAARAPTLSNSTPAPATAMGEEKTTASGVKYTTVKEGKGAVAKAGNHVTVHYTGTLEDGRKFDSSRDRDKPAEFSIGTGSVIKGWDEAVPGMLIGEQRKLIIPPGAGYGAQGKPPTIPPNATLLFDIELIDVK